MTEQVADVILVVEFRAEPQGQALHRQQVLRLRHHHAQVLQLEERPELATRTMY
ncbi:MAG: hypothetical protein ABI661_09125 [Gammaproteobacteria bacterium]